MNKFTAYAIVAVALLLLGFTQSSFAVTCDSFTSAAACDGVFTDAGRCKWNAATRTCETSGESLPEGMVGITSIPDNVELTPGPSGSEGSSGTFGSPPPVNGSGPESMAYAPAPEPENLPLSRIFEDGNVQAAAGPGSEDRDFKPPTNSSFCTQPSAQGDCRAYIPSFFYNSESGVCEDFVYGGCGGNLNNFPTLEDCAEAAVKYCGADPEKVVTSRAQATISRALSGIFVAMLISLALRQ